MSNLNPDETTFIETAGDQLAIGVRFDKVDIAKRTVEGFATLDNVDKTGEIVDFEASKEAFNDWVGNIREMHGPLAVGKALSVEQKNKEGVGGKEYRGMYVKAYISRGANDTWEKILDGTLGGFSIGGRVLEKRPEVIKTDGDNTYSRMQVNRITKYKLGELSVVDNPANPLALFDKVNKNISSASLVKYDNDNELHLTDTVSIDELSIFYCKPCDEASVYQATNPINKCLNCDEDLMLVALAYEPQTEENIQKMVFDFLDLKKLQEEPESDSGKVTKASVHYDDAEEGGDSCGSCAYFLKGLGACAKVAGNISPNYICDIYEETPDDIDTTPIEVYNNVTQKIEKAVTGANKTPPKGYPQSRSQYADPANYKYPIDSPERIRAAMVYFNHSGQQSAGGYSSSQWAAIGRKIASAANRVFGPGHRYSNGSVMMQNNKSDLLQNVNDDKNINKLFEDFIGAIADKISAESFAKIDGGDFEKVDNQALNSIRDVLKSAIANVEDILTKAGVTSLNSENATDVSVAASTSLPAPIADNSEPGQPDASGNDATADTWAAPPADSNVLPHMGKSEETETEEKVEEEEAVVKNEEVVEEKQDEGELIKSLLNDELAKFSAKTVEALNSISNSINEVTERVAKIENSGAGKKSGEVNEELTKSAPKSFWGGAFSVNP